MRLWWPAGAHGLDWGKKCTAEGGTGGERRGPQLPVATPGAWSGAALPARGTHGGVGTLRSGARLAARWAGPGAEPLYIAGRPLLLPRGAVRVRLGARGAVALAAGRRPPANQDWGRGGKGRRPGRAARVPPGGSRPPPLASAGPRPVCPAPRSSILRSCLQPVLPLSLCPCLSRLRPFLRLCGSGLGAALTRHPPLQSSRSWSHAAGGLPGAWLLCGGPCGPSEGGGRVGEGSKLREGRLGKEELLAQGLERGKPWALPPCSGRSLDGFLYTRWRRRLSRGPRVGVARGAHRGGHSPATPTHTHLHARSGVRVQTGGSLTPPLPCHSRKRSQVP